MSSTVTSSSLFMASGPQRRPRGRPRVDEPRSTVSTWVPASYHDRLVKMANRQDVSVSMLVRSLLMLQIKRQ
jgi:hypothetical protein